MHNGNDIVIMSAEEVAEALDSKKIDPLKMTELVKKSETITTYSTQDKDIVIVAGKPGAGKSTFVKFILGTDVDLQKAASEIIDIAVSANEANSQSDLAASSTKYPHIYHDSEELTYCDMPHLDKDSTFNERIWSAISLEMILKKAKNVRLVFIIDMPSLSQEYLNDLTYFLKL